MNNIDLSTCGKFVEGWNNGSKVIWAAVSQHGLHGAMGVCLDYLRKWSGEEPTISKALKAKLDAADMNLIRMAFAAEWR